MYSISGLSTVTIPFPFTWLVDGVATDPVSLLLEWAFKLDDRTKPGSSDWHPGTWETWSVAVGTPYRAVTPTIGPGGLITNLTARPQPYWAWPRVTAASDNIWTPASPIPFKVI